MFLSINALFEVERNLFVCELGVNSSIRVSSCLNICLVLAVKVNLENPAAINLAPGPLANNLGRVDNVVENGILHRSKSTGARKGTLGLLRAGVGLAKDCTLRDKNDMTSRELLLQLTDETLLNFIEGFQELVRNVKDDGLLSTSAINLLSSSDVEVTKRSLELRRGHLKVEELLSNGSFELIRLL